jgi:hypothetical protein
MRSNREKKKPKADKNKKKEAAPPSPYASRFSGSTVQNGGGKKFS